jgi:hypothetical protein
MLRRLFTALSALSLLLCVGVGVLWVWTLSREADADRLLAAAPVAIDFSDVAPSGVLRPAGYVIRKGDLVVIELYDLAGPGTTITRSQRVSDKGEVVLPAFSVVADGRTASELGAAVGRGYGRDGRTLDVRVVDERPRVAAWWLAGLFVLPPAALFSVNTAVTRRRRRRESLGQCPACGYDLRATPGRCPGCGTLGHNGKPPAASAVTCPR